MGGAMPVKLGILPPSAVERLMVRRFRLAG